jgi:Uma2 family endonuclease
VELIEGEIIDMPPQKDPHAWAVSRLVRELMRLFPSPFWVKIQATLRLNDFSAPEPDIAVLSGPPSPPATSAPIAVLIVEVSDTTLHYDRGEKASLYAANGVADYWAADVVHQQVEVFRETVRDGSQRYGWGYGKVAVFKIGDRVIPLADPTVSVDVSEFLD